MPTPSAVAGTALITGASRGIGYEFARVCAAEGHDVIMSASGKQRLTRKADKVSDEFGIAATPIVADLASPEGPTELYEQLPDDDIDILINNAGIAGPYGPFYRADHDRVEDLIQLNLTSVTHLTWLCLQDMIERDHGRILNVASTAAFSPGPLMAVYHATKSYVLLFSEAIAEELNDTGVSVSVLCPGRTSTDFLGQSGIEESTDDPDPGIAPETVAEAGYRGMMAGRTLVYSTRKHKLETIIPQVLPRSLVRKIAHRRERERDRRSTVREDRHE